MSNVSQFFGGGIKSIQRVTAAAKKEADGGTSVTINPVNLNKAFLNLNSIPTITLTSATYITYTVKFVDNQTVNVSRSDDVSSPLRDMNISFEIVEFA